MEFHFALKGNAEEKLAQAKAAAASRGVTMIGDAKQGEFGGLITGSYEVAGEDITVFVTRKPMIASWPMIEKQLRIFLEG
ncbi:MAG TPA: hypothetical protein VJ547_09070 [Candidatus Thermoplasmatota archaeon]|nr:hypothetical protein [Candidatus Thermoplasmatota archaeon]